MSYRIDSGIWSSVFAVPTEIVDRHIKMCSPLALKILLVMLRHSGEAVSVKWISEQLNMSTADVSDALNYWIGTGIINETGDTGRENPVDQAQPPVQSPAVKNVFVQEQPGETSTQKIVTISSRQKISRDDIAEMSKKDATIPQLLTEAQEIFGAPLTPVESEILVALHSYYGLQTDAILMLLQYCVSIGKRSMNYIEKTAASWLEKGIQSHEQIEQEICRLMRQNENEKKVVKAFGIYNRGLTTKERDYTAQWFSIGMDERLIFLACERAMENTGKVSFAYADKILQSWKAKGISTIKDAVADLNSNTYSKQQKQRQSAQTGADSSLDKSELRDLLHKQFSD